MSDSTDGLLDPGTRRDTRPVYGPPLLPEEHRRKRSLVRKAFGSVPAAVYGGLVGLLAVFVITYHVDYVAFVPGGATDLGDRIAVTGMTQYPPKGRIFLATVGLTPKLTPAQVAYAWISPDRDVKKFKDVYGTSTADEKKFNQVLMDDSKLTATLVALRFLGRDGVGSGVRIVEVGKGTPAAGRLQVGDVVQKVDGKQICLNGDLRSGIRSGARKDPVQLTVLRKATGTVEELTIVPAYDAASSLRYLGVAAETVRCALPVDIKVDTGAIGGPSAGLSMTLAIIDRLTPGELTGGVAVAATGTIDVDGSVGDVGGVRQKTAAVKAAGAKLFLVPPGEERDARSRAGDLPVVVVHSLTDALAALRRYGGQSLPSPGAAR